MTQRVTPQPSKPAKETFGRLFDQK